MGAFPHSLGWVLGCVLVGSRLARTLPVQNIVGAVVTIGFVGLAWGWILAWCGSPSLYLAFLKPNWIQPESILEVFLAWPTLLLGCRVGCQRVLQPYRYTQNYGYWLLAISSISTTVVVEISHLGLNLMGSNPLDEHIHTTAIAWIVTLIAALLSLVSATPWLVKQFIIPRPRQKSVFPSET